MQNNSTLFTTKMSGDWQFERVIAKLFIFFFPFKMFSPLQFLSGWTFGLADVASFLFCAIGLVCIICRGRISFRMDQGTKVLKRFAIMYVVCDIASIIMAVFLHEEAGIIAGEGTYDATFKKILFTFAYILFVFYGSEVWRLLSKKEIDRVIGLGIDVSIAVGLLQILVLLGFDPAMQIYEIVNSFFNAWSSSLILQTKRIALLTNEPAYSASYLAAFAMPYLLSCCLYFGVKRRFLIRIILCVVVMYFTKSTTGYVLLSLDILMFLLLYLKKSRQSIGTRILVFVLISFLLFAIVMLIVANANVSNTISGVFDKLFNENNVTSSDRKATASVNLSIFTHYPILGVGNGNQGFFYQRFMPQWAVNMYNAKNTFKKAGTILYDGGPFWMAHLSGYGFVGIIMLCMFIIPSIKSLKKFKNKCENLYEFYILSIVAIFVNGIAATMGSTYFMWFMFSLPVTISSIEYDEVKKIQK